MPRTKAMFFTFLIVTFVSVLVGIICMLPIMAIIDMICGVALGYVVVFAIAIIFNVLYEKEREE